MRLLVTGGAGYIGSVVAVHLLDAGHEVTVVDDLSTGHADAVPQGAVFHQLPITGLDPVLGDWHIEAVIHFAAKSLVGESAEQPSLYWRNNVVGSVEETVRMFAQVDHPGLGLLMDPTNYFETHNIDRMDQILNQVFDTLTDKIRIAHAKDVKRSGSDKSEKHADIGDDNASEGLTFRGVGEIELPAPGLGSLNYDLYLQRLAQKHPNIPVIIEHLTEDDVPRAKTFLDGKFRANGL